ncbi:organomercurial lyase [Streptomyces sioyaensis]|uniref:organomercurial lyase n=1 Tax=Streptomyces sioyaensis TaxID=67364 RepID=UPI0037918265
MVRALARATERRNRSPPCPPPTGSSSPTASKCGPCVRGRGPLGIPDMLGTDAVIISADAVTGGTITVTSTGGRMTWLPSMAVVYIGRRSCTGPAVEVACGALNFFTSRCADRSWVKRHSDYTGKAVPPASAETLGRSVFGRLLEESEPA